MGTPVTDTPSLLPAAQSFNVSRIITWTWGIIFALMTFTIVTIKRDGITLDPYSLIDPLGALGGLFGVMVYRHIHPVMVKNKFSIRLRWQKRHLPRAWYVVQLINQFAFGTHTIVILSYLGARLAFPLFDTQLSHIDQALSFDWYGFIGWVDRHPIIAKSLTFSYHSMNAEVILCIAIFAVLHHDAQLHRFVLQFLVSAFICVTIATLVPALGPYGFYHIEPSQYPNLKVYDQKLFLIDLFSMRGGAVIFPKVFTGLVTFPSFHTIFAVLMINAAAYLPGRSAKIIIILLNLAMIASTITDGGHYLADVLGGAIIAVVVICISNYFIPVTARFANLDNKAHAKG